MKLLHTRNAKTSAGAREAGSRALERQARELVTCMETMRRRMTHRMPWKDLPVGLSVQDVKAFTVLSDHDSVTMSDYAKAMGVPLSTATHAVERLVNKGVAVRYRIEEDRRVVRVRLSDKGRKMQQAFNQVRLDMGRAMLSSLTRGEREIFLELMAKIALQGKPGDDGPQG
jgi:DNA-binding MarR family transcriptional regulator